MVSVEVVVSGEMDLVSFDFRFVAKDLFNVLTC